MKRYIFQIRQLVNLKVLSIWLIVIILLSSSIAVVLVRHKDDNKRLELVQILFRHGERTPSEIEYTKIPYVSPSVYQPYGFAQLTNTGRLQAYELGTLLRKRYTKYLDDVYHDQDLYAYSSESDRTMMTMQLVLAGMYPPTENFQWNPVLNWLPIPYFYTPAKFDVLLRAMEGEKFNEIRKRETDHLLRAKNENEYADLLKILEDEFGPSGTIDRLSSVHNVLHANDRMGIPLPKWCSRDTLLRLQEYFTFQLDCFSYTAQMRRMNGGPLIKKFVDNMNINKMLYNPRKMYLYSGHDFTIAAVVRALEITNFRYSDYASAIIVEKLRGANNQIYIRLVGRRGPEGEFKTLKIGDCSEFCPIEEFLAIAVNVIPSDKEMHHLEREFRGSLTEDIFLHDPYIKKR